MIVAVLEENRVVLEQQILDLRAKNKKEEVESDRLLSNLQATQQHLQNTQDQMKRWKDRCEALVEQLQAEQNRAILAEKAAVEHLNKNQALKLHAQQVIHAFIIFSAKQ